MAADTVEISVDLPALGKPTSATSAMSLSSMSSQNSWPFSACSAKAGARRRLERKRALPAAALAALGHHEAGALDVEVAHDGAAALAHDRADRDRHHQVLAPGAVLLGARAVHAVGGPAERVVPEAEQRRLVHRGDEPDVPAVTAVAAVGATAVHVGLPAPRDRPGSPVAGARVQLGLVDEAGT